MSRTSVFAFAALCTFVGAPLAHSAELPLASVTANSVLVDRSKGITYGAENMMKARSGAMWVEGESSSGLGKYVEFVFAGPVEVHSLRIFGGCFVDADFWKRHNRVQTLEFMYADFTSEKIELKDVMQGQFIKLAAPKKVSKIKAYLRAVYEGSTWHDTPITRVQFFDAGGPDEIQPKSATASSEFEDKDHLYAPSKLIDGWDDTYWVNGPGSGEGETMTVDLGGSQTIRKFGITTGFAETEGFFKGSNRAARVTADLGGTRKTFELDDVGTMQVFDLGAITASTVTVTVESVRKGDAHDDLYVGELRFWK